MTAPTFEDALRVLNDLGTHLSASIDDIEKTGDLQTLLRAFYRAKIGYKSLEEALKVIYHLKDRLDKNVVPQRIEDSGFDKVQVAAIGQSFYPLVKYSASIIDKSKGFDWLRANGAGELITETVNAGTLASFCKDMIENENKEPPSDIFIVTPYKITGISKYTPKPTKTKTKPAEMP